MIPIGRFRKVFIGEVVFELDFTKNGISLEKIGERAFLTDGAI